MSGTSRQQIRLSQQFMNDMDGKSGVYFVTARRTFEALEKDPDDKMLVKVGLAQNLSHRLNSYLLCWPEGMYVFGIIFTSNKDAAKRTERSIHGYLNIKGKYYVSSSSRDEEWFEISKSEISKILKLMEANSTTNYPNDYPKEKLRNKRVFLYTGIYDLGPTNEILVIANEQVGQDRVKPITSDLKRELDKNLRDATPSSPLFSDIKPKKPTKKGNKVSSYAY